MTLQKNSDEFASHKQVICLLGSSEKVFLLSLNLHLKLRDNRFHKLTKNFTKVYSFDFRSETPVMPRFKTFYVLISITSEN